MHIKISSILISLLIFSGCDSNMIKSDLLDDDQMIQNILDAEKIDINMTNLPSSSSNIINQYYNDYIEMDVKMAAGLGYQVSMDGKGYKPGYHNEIYFNLEGRELKPNKNRFNRDGFKCFELILPVTFLMPDGSHILVNNENDYMIVRDWFGNNSDSIEKPRLQYPVNIINKNGSTDIINDDQEMVTIKENCSKWDDGKKDWSCFKLVYPISFIVQDGSTILMLDDEDWTQLKTWYEVNPNIEEDPALEYPVEINYEDGVVLIINNNDEMINAKEGCRD